MPLMVSREREIIYRNAEKLLQKHIKDYLDKYTQYPREKILTYVAYELAVKLQNQELVEETTPLVNKIQALDDELEELLSDK